jgi:tRNA 2-selenouridine synthase
LQGQIAAIDVRSEAEFADGTIPGSVNIPLFTNEERSLIGTIYKQQSPEAAKDRGVELVAGKLPEFVRSLQSIGGRKALFCWRGGMRSRTSATLLELLERDVWQLRGGYRAFRQWVAERLLTYEFPVPLYVLSGMTGSGKTAVLRALGARGIPILDLEQLAGHRGSIFGGIGMQPVNQRTFEANLLIELEKIRLAADQGKVRFVVIEGESRRIGKVMLPDFLLTAKQNARLIILEMSMEQRVLNILQDYAPQMKSDAFVEAFRLIARRFHTPIATEIRKALATGEFAQAVRLLLQHHYDPRYAHALAEYVNPAGVINASDVPHAVEKMIEILAFGDRMFC